MMPVVPPYRKMPPIRSGGEELGGEHGGQARLPEDSGLARKLLSWHGTSEPRLTTSCSSNTGDTAAVLLPPAADQNKTCLC